MGLLELHWLVQEELLKALDVVSLFLLSFASRKTKRLIQSIRFGEYKAKIFVDGKSNLFEIKLLSLLPTDFVLIFKSRTGFASEETGDLHVKKKPKLALVINDSTLKVRRLDHSRQETTFWLNKKYRDVMHSELVKYLCELFHETVFGVELHKIHKHLSVGGIRDIKFGDIWEHSNQKEVIQAKHLDKFLRKVPTKECLTITYKLRGIFPSDSPFYQVKDLFVNDGKNMTGVDLRLFQGENAFICHASMDYSDVAAFLGHWIKGKSKRLETMIVSTRKPMTIDKDELKERFGARRWNQSQRAQHYVYPVYDHVRSEIGKVLSEKDFDCSSGFDIERFDGRLATVKFARNRFFFFVWNHRLSGPLDTFRKYTLEVIAEEDEEEEEMTIGIINWNEELF